MENPPKRKSQPLKARGTFFQNRTRSSWFELFVRAVLYVERHAAGPFRYSAVSDFLKDCGVTDAWGKPIPVGTLKRTIKRDPCRQMLKDFRVRYQDASDAELLQFEPDAPLGLRTPAEPTFEEFRLIEDFLSRAD